MQTLKREICSVCKKKNLCTFRGTDGKEKTVCKTSDCQGYTISQEQKEEQKSFIDSATLNFYTPDSYRGISKLTLELLRIQVAELGSQQVVQYIHQNLDGTTDTKRRYPGKVFDWKDKQPTTSMFGLDRCTDFLKPLYITEGNEDAATLWELGFQAASILSATNEIINIEQDIETINKYPSIYICIENDKAGQKAKFNIKQLLKHKLLYEVDLSPRKDANDWIRDDLPDLVPNRQELLNRIIKAGEIVPEGIIFGDQIDSEELRTPLPKGVFTGYRKIDQLVYGGCIPGDVWLWTGGVSIGKSTGIRRLCTNFKQQGLKVGNIFVEESKQVSMLNYIAEETGYPIGDVLLDPTIIPQEEWDRAFYSIVYNNDLMFINEKWERTTNNLLKTIKYLAEVKKYDIIVVDHITAITNSSGVGRGGKVHDIDWFMEQIFNLCRQTGIRVHLISHLKRPAQPPYWDEGRRPSIYDLRGSGSLEGKPDVIVSLFRNMKDQYNVDNLTFEVLKNRWFSKIGIADELTYIESTGRLIYK